MAGTRGGVRRAVGTRDGAARIAGTRGGIGRIAAMVIGLAVVAALVLADAARAGTYNVAQCGWGIGAELDPSVPGTEGVGATLRPGYCTSPPPGTAQGVMFFSWMANDGEAVLARARWAAPPGTNITAASFTWSGELMSGFWQTAGIDNGAEFVGLVFFTQSSAPHVVATVAGGPARAFEVRLECLFLGAAGCDRSSFFSQMSLSGLTLTIDDPVKPQARLGGTLAAGGWHRGTVPVEVAAEDPAGAGLYREEATVDGAPVLGAPIACAVATIEGEVRATRLRPCPTTATQGAEVDTTVLADGTHTLQGCAVDFGGGQGCAPAVHIQVDNSPPTVEFAAAPEGQVVATVSDAFSGPAGGMIAVRRADSESWADLPTTVEHGGTLRAQLPELGGGTFFFRATATDAAGNSGSAQLRASGSALEVRRQLAGAGDGSGPAARGGRRGARGRGRGTHLVVRLVSEERGSRAASPLTVDFGTAAKLRGRLTDAHGDGVPNQPVTVVLRAPGGAAGAPERHRLLTDRAGRFALRLEPRTSRRVLVSFHGGGGLRPAHGRPLALKVRAAVSLAAVPSRLRTGDSVTLSGRVRPGAARIPRRGKVVAIQYLERASGRWRPALVVRTDGRGRFHVRYRFRYITGAARIRLRATALPEAGWPYAAGSSPPVTVEVHGG
ncbi:MAG: hypothetical protein ACRDPE_01450 [Solirubrobacterales bacterium]